MTSSNKQIIKSWKIVPMRGYENRGWVEIYDADHKAVISAEAFDRHTSYGETETHFGVRISPENARLIIALPDLLAACKRAKEWLEGSTGVASKLPAAIEVYKSLCAVIAKVEGRCPHCQQTECICSDFDVSSDQGAKG